MPLCRSKFEIIAPETFIYFLFYLLQSSTDHMVLAVQTSESLYYDYYYLISLSGAFYYTQFNAVISTAGTGWIPLVVEMSLYNCKRLGSLSSCLCFVPCGKDYHPALSQVEKWAFSIGKGT